MHLLNCFFLKLARDFYVVTLPTIVKIQDSPSALPLPVSGHLRIRIRYRESGGLTPRRGVAAPVTRCWHLRLGGQCLVIQWGQRVRSQPAGLMSHGGVLSPGCGHLMTVSVIMVIIVIMIHDTNLSLSRRVRHTTTGHQPHHTSQLGPRLLKNIRNNIRYKSLYSLTTSRWYRSSCKKSLILMHFLCFTQLRGAWCRPILYL